MKKKLSREFKVGVFGIAMVALLYISINFIKSNRIFSSDKTFYAIFKTADGLEASAPVMTKGFRIGTVEKVEFDLYSQDIIVTFSVEKEYPLPSDTKVKITSTGLMGGKIIEVLIGSNHSAAIPNKDTIQSVFEPSLFEMASSEYTTLKDKLASFSNKLDNALTGIESAMSPENMNNLKGSLENLNTVTADVAQIINNRKQNLENLLKNLDNVSSELNKTMPDIRKTFANLSSASDSIPAIFTNINGAVNSVNQIISHVNNGQGNLGKLVQDEQLYNNLTQSLTDLSLLITDLKENPKKYINVVVFPRKEKAPKIAK